LSLDYFVFYKMKVKMLTRDPNEYLRETKRDIHKGEFTYSSQTVILTFVLR